MIESVFDGRKYKWMYNRPLKSVVLDQDKEGITFTFLDDSVETFKVEGDCCSHSWVEHLEVPDDLEGAIILGIEDADMEPHDGHECDDPDEYNSSCGHECLQVYHTRFQTDKGAIVLEYRNDSNGYYGGWLEPSGNRSRYDD